MTTLIFFSGYSCFYKHLNVVLAKLSDVPELELLRFIYDRRMLCDLNFLEYEKAKLKSQLFT